MKRDAYFSKCRDYRYSLSRIWDDTQPYVVFIGLNPSTADDKDDDQTIKRCIKYAQDWGYGGLYMANLFAYRATKPKDMKGSWEPIGKDNDFWLLKLSQGADKVIAAWGNDGDFRNRAKQVLELLPDMYCLKQNKTGHPAHPSRAETDLKPIKMHPYKE